MADFTLNSLQTTGYTMVNGDNGLIGKGGSILVQDGDAISGTGSVDVFSGGTIMAAADKGIDISDGITVDIFLTSTSQIASKGDGVQVLLDDAGNLDMANAGTIEAASDAVDIRGDGDNEFVEFSNTGTILGGSDALVIGATSRAFFINSGTAIGNFSAIATNVGGTDDVVTVINIGTISALNDNLLNAGSTTTHIIKNSGEMVGDLTFATANDVYNGRGGTITGVVSGEDGDDVLKGGDGDEEFDGGRDKDLLMGGGGDDTLTGGNGADTLMGGKGDDVLDGGAKSDVLSGGKGDDTLTGGAQADTFLFARAAGNDVITDFEDGSDIIDLTAFNLKNFNALNSSGALSNEENAVNIDLSLIGGSGTIIVDGIQVGDLSSDDFLF